VSGGNANRILYIDVGLGGGDVTVSGLTLTAGNSTGLGGAISNHNAALTIRNATISGSISASSGGGIYSGFGALTVQRSTISGNSAAMLSQGGGIRVRFSNLTIEDSTISGNSAGGGGGISARTPGMPTIEGSTISGNTGGGIYAFDSSNPVLTNTIVANNGDDIQVSGTTPGFDLAFSLVENPGVTPLNQTAANILGSDPQLEALAFNGGATQTHAVRSTSPAIDQGSDTGTDQRGRPRMVDFLGAPNAVGLGANVSDIGAFEFQPPKCKGKPATIVGTAKNVNGTAKKDVIVGTAGKNVIRGRGGNDRICGGKGNDRLIGGAGRDRLYGEAGRDTLLGGKGRDKLVGGPGKDTQRQ